MPLETEVKIRIADVEAVCSRLRDLGYRVHAERVFESNTTFDFSGRLLSRKGELLRIRRAGDKALVTFKGRSRWSAYKSREEIETAVEDPGAVEQILTRLGLSPSFRYEKYRTEYSREGSSGIVTVDETPIGNYLEIEGAPDWIDSAAAELGYSQSDYITNSYGALYAAYCRARRVQPSNMVFANRDED